MRIINGWISPIGKFLPCDLMGHSELAFNIIRDNETLKNKFRDNREKYNDILDFMYDEGYREVRTWPTGKTYFLPENRKWNSHQVKVAVNICIELEIETPEVLYG